MDAIITFAIVMLIMVAKIARLNLRAVRHRLVRTMAFVFHIWKTKLNTNSTAHVKTVSLEKLVK